MNNATKTVLEMGKIALTGDIVPPQWFSKIKRESGTVHLEAIVLLARVCYWYRPTIIRDEETGAVKGYERKFAADKLQMSYTQIAEQFGISKDSAKAAVDTLERLGLVIAEFRNIGLNGKGYSNVLYLAPIPTAISSLTHADPCASQLAHGGGMCQPVGRPSASQLADDVPASRQTYTEVTTETTTDSQGTAKSAVPPAPETPVYLVGVPITSQKPGEGDEAYTRRVEKARSLQKSMEAQQGQVDVTWLLPPLQVLALEFCAVSGCRPIKRDQSNWIKEIGAWVELGFTPQTIREAYHKLVVVDHLTCSGPQSLTNTARSFVNAARAGMNEYSEAATTKLHVLADGRVQVGNRLYPSVAAYHAQA